MTYTTCVAAGVVSSAWPAGVVLSWLRGLFGWAWICNCGTPQGWSWPAGKHAGIYLQARLQDAPRPPLTRPHLSHPKLVFRWMMAATQRPPVVIMPPSTGSDHCNTRTRRNPDTCLLLYRSLLKTTPLFPWVSAWPGMPGSPDRSTSLLVSPCCIVRCS